MPLFSRSKGESKGDEKGDDGKDAEGYGGASTQLIADVAQHCVDDKFLGEWRVWMEAHEAAFAQEEGRGGEHKLEFTDRHREFVAMVERRLEDFLRSRGESSESFYALCRGVAEGGVADEDEEATEALVETFAALITMATEYGAFVDVMRSREKRAYLFQMMGIWRQQLEMEQKRSDG